jgi:isoleucyl-tRNA synthetase
MHAKLKVRQPLAKVEVILVDAGHQPWLEAHEDLLRDELNVKAVEYTADADQYISYQVQPNFKRLGPRLGKLMPAVKQRLGQVDGGSLLNQLEKEGKIALEVDGNVVELDNEDIQVRLQAREGWTAAQGTQCVVVLSTDLTDQLVREGYAQDIKRLIQERRKELQCQYTDRIGVGLVTDAEEVWRAVEENREFLRNETLALAIEREALDGVEAVEVKVAGQPVRLFVQLV